MFHIDRGLLEKCVSLADHVNTAHFLAEYFFKHKLRDK
jgi:hypothetical protein